MHQKLFDRERGLAFFDGDDAVYFLYCELLFQSAGPVDVQFVDLRSLA